eukprot:14776217-Alexandrium_andersonii.AAC.1
MVRVLSSWLAPRTVRVVLQGRSSREIRMPDMVYQGTVFGPSLRNLFFAAARRAIRSSGFSELVYVDDLNARR